VIISLLLAGLTAFFVKKKWWGAATFTGMMWFYFLWEAMLVLLNAMFIGKSMGF
jgi:hypothetical protein